MLSSTIEDKGGIEGLAANMRYKIVDMIAIAVSTVLIVSCQNSSLEIRPVMDEKTKPDIRPRRIVSLDFCADQYVLKFVEPSRILALSPDAAKPFSYMRENAKGLKTVRPHAEDVLALEPDLVVRSYGGGPQAERFFQAAGVEVLNVGWAGDMDGIMRVSREMAEGLHAPDKGRVLVSEIERRLEAVKSKIGGDVRPKALYLTPSGVTSGAGSYVDALLLASGLQNFEARSGWRAIPLERLTMERPDMVVAGFFDSLSYQKDAWSAMRHPLARAQMTDLPTVSVKGSWMSCGAWFALDAIEAMAQGKTDVIEGDVDEKADNAGL